ncbi:MAG TPA: bifunctional UDP-N-acetylglucosamine diphosphorylase/glucosamine-1-phosphate N-acetyltransferase GlmU [Solirubrobacteraceae bacterium]|nr:bifunctional UDP-N-acetylglucosamine diphosphorylase/glucosamine-1-phosphate N-acetyltransferase GlmU [Solirubrobacteraceae bacterium]
MNAPTVVILAAGQGTRMRSGTPKVLHDLCGRPLIDWPVAAARAAGAGRIIVVDAPGGTLGAHLGGEVEIAVQPEPDGTGGAAVAAAPLIDPATPVLILMADVPLVSAPAIAGLLAAHAASGAAATVATTVLEDPAGYGRIVRGPDGAVERIVETKTNGDATPAERGIREVNTGIYAFEGTALLGALPRLRADNAQGERYLTDALGILRSDGAAVTAHEVDEPLVVLGINDRVQLAQAREIVRRRIIEGHLLAGVDIVDPASTIIDADVTLGQDTVIEPFTVLRGATRAGAGCRIGPGATLIDVALGDGATVLHSYAIEAEIHAGASVGPFAYLRPGTVLRERSKVGTFVEVKNSDVGEGTKVPHLSYLGDADVGPGTNLGAGSITANYDGVAKHRTTIGAGVKGSIHTSYVAPVTLGDRAWTAAGSVITEDVPAGALAVARARQSNIEGYDARREAERKVES